MLITELTVAPQVVSQLAEMMVEAVAHGGSLHFMHPLEIEPASAFWEKSLVTVARGTKNKWRMR